MSVGTLIRPRRDTALNWQTNNPVLAVGEVAFETDTGKGKIGDGVSAWKSLLNHVLGGRWAGQGFYQPSPAALGMALYDPNLDALMSPAPEIGEVSAAKAASTLTNPIEWPIYSSALESSKSAIWRNFGWPSAEKGGVFFSAGYQAWTYLIGTPMMFFDIETDSPLFEIQYADGPAGALLMRIDGQLAFAPASAITAPAGSGEPRRRTVKLPTRQMRHVELAVGGGFRPIGITTNKTDTVTISRRPLGPRVFWQGDSFPESVSGRTNNFTGYPYRVSRILGWRDLFNVAVGGTDLLSNGGGTNGKKIIIERMAADVYANLATNRPNILFLTNTAFNDVSNKFTTAQIAAALLELLNNVKANAPNMVVLIQGANPIGTGSTPEPFVKYEEANTAMLTALQANPSLWSLWIDPIKGTWAVPDGRTGGSGKPWFTGSGFVGKEKNDGTADICASAATPHPTDAGDQVNTRDLVSAVREAFWSELQAA